MSTPITLQTYVQQGIYYVVCKGEFDETNVDTQFEVVHNFIDPLDEKKFVLLDLGEVNYVNSKFIGYVADISNQLEEHGGRIVMTATQNVRDTLQICGIHQIIEILDDIPAGKKYFLDSYGDFLRQKEIDMEKQAQEALQKSAEHEVGTDSFFGSAPVSSDTDMQPVIILDEHAQEDEQEGETHNSDLSETSSIQGSMQPPSDAIQEDHDLGVQSNSLGLFGDDTDESIQDGDIETDPSHENEGESGSSFDLTDLGVSQEVKNDEEQSEEPKQNAQDKGGLFFEGTKSVEVDQKEDEATINTTTKDPESDLLSSMGFFTQDEKVEDMPLSEQVVEESEKNDPSGLSLFGSDTQAQSDSDDLPKDPDSSDTMVSPSEIVDDTPTPSQNDTSLFGTDEITPFGEVSTQDDGQGIGQDSAGGLFQGEEKDEGVQESKKITDFATDDQYGAEKPWHNDAEMSTGIQSGEVIPDIVFTQSDDASAPVDQIEQELEEIREQIEALQNRGRELFEEQQALLSSNQS